MYQPHEDVIPASMRNLTRTGAFNFSSIQVNTRYNNNSTNNNNNNNNNKNIRNQQSRYELDYKNCVDIPDQY